MSEQTASPKETLVALIRSHVAASTSGDPILIQYANNNLTNFLNQIEVTVTETEEEPAE